MNNLPITYQKSMVQKEFIKEKDLYKADLDSFDTTIGQVTNYSTSFYDLLCKYKGKNDGYSKKCFNEILERLKLTRQCQGNSIDAAKGIKVDPYPSIWIRPQKITPEDTEEVKQQKIFLNDICADKKPYFFRYRYPTSEKEYIDFITSKKKWSSMYFNKTLDEVLNEEKPTEQEQKFIEDYYKYVPLINYHSPMNNICQYLEKELAVIKNYKADPTSEEVVQLMQTQEVELYPEVEGVLKTYYNEYSDKKRNLKSRQKGVLKPITQEDDCIINIDQYAKVLRQRAEDFFSNLTSKDSLNETIANYVVEYFYKKYPSKSKSFVWSVFGKYIVENIKKNTLLYTNTTTVPFRSEFGDIDYLGCNYGRYIINIDNIEQQKQEGNTNG